MTRLPAFVPGIVAAGVLCLLCLPEVAMAVAWSQDSERDHQVWLREPNYLVFDAHGDIKILQSFTLRALSFHQYSLWAPDLDVHMGIKAFWGFSTEDSQPFDEVNWNPEILLRWEISYDMPIWVPHHVSVGRSHESDGVAADSSRGWDRWIFYSTWRFPLDDKGSFFDAQGSIWTVSAYERHWAPDMPTYLGFMNWLVTLRLPAWVFKLEFRVTDNQRALAYDSVRNAGGHYPHPQFHSDEARWYVHVPIIPSIRAGAGVKLPFEWQDFFVYGEYFEGYAEGLMHFNQRTSALRIGIALVPDL